MNFATVIGGAIAFYIIYAIFALFFKHGVGLTVSTILWAFAGIALLIAQHDGFVMISAVVGFFAVLLISPIQIRSPEKEAKRAKKKTDPPKRNSSK